MSVTCLVSHTANDLRCPVCGQGFLVFDGSRMSGTAHAEMRQRVRLTMREHHVTHPPAAYPGGREVHPRTAFLVEGEDRGFDLARSLSLESTLLAAAC